MIRRRAFRYFALSVFALVLVASCATPPPAQPPLPVSKPGGSFYLGRVKALDVTDHMTQHVDRNRNILYFQNFGGGGAGLGLLLGPVGVAANMAMIESATKQEAEQLRDKIAIDPPAVFSAAAKRAGTAVQTSPSTDAPPASPYLYVAKTDPETLVIAAGLLVESGDPSVPWARKYILQLPGSYTLLALSALDQQGASRLARELEDGYVALLRRLPAESADSIEKEPPVKIKSALITPRFEYELLGRLAAEDADVVWVRLPMGLFGIRRSHVTYTVQKP
jgi:hypothetical protein